MDTLIPLVALIYVLGILGYRYDTNISWARAFGWPWFLLIDLIGAARLYRRAIETAPAVHPWINKRVVVADTELNQQSEHWKLHIGKQGKVISSVGDEYVSVWIDKEIVPHQDVLPVRFVLL